MTDDKSKKKKKYPKLYQCRTVGEMIEELGKLPRDMAASSEMDEGVVMVPVNVGHPDEHLDISTVYDTAWSPGDSWLERE